MYNRLFTKILDSSIWLEPLPTRVVWITLLAAMDEDGFASFACPANVARRAGVDLDETEKALDCLLSPDPNSSDPDNDGRRIEKIPGGYIVLNACKYRELFSREIRREQTRKRVEKHREKSRPVTPGNASVTQDNDSVTQSEADAPSDAQQKKSKEPPSPPMGEPASPWLVAFDLELPESIRTDECLDALKLWLAYKKERREAYKPIGLKAALTKWANEFTPDTLPTSIRHSIANQWKGIFAHSSPANASQHSGSVTTADPRNGTHHRPAWARRRALEDEQRIILDRTPTSTAGRHWAPGDKERMQAISRELDSIAIEEAG